MAALRTCALLVLVAAAATISAQYTGAGCSSHSVNLFGNSSETCANAVACQAAFCTCIGATAGSNWTCTTPTTMPNCTAAATCVATKIACINKAADNTSCTQLRDLRMANVAVAAGSLYNASAGYTACRSEACMLLNSTSGNCSIDYHTICASPVNFHGTVRLRGEWATILASADLRNKLKAALEADIAAALGFPAGSGGVTVTKIAACATKRRRVESNLCVEFTIAGVSVNNANLKTAVTGLKDGKFLVKTLAEYKAVNGASSGFTFAGIAVGAGSSASYLTTGSGGTSTTTGTTSTTASTTGTTSTTASTAGSTSTTSTGTSGAATQSLLLAAAVAVLGALLF